MKKAIIFILGCLISVCCFAQDFEMKLIAKLQNKKETNFLYILPKEKLDSYEGVTGNNIKIDSKGKLYVYQEDTRIVYNIDTKNDRLINKKDYKLLPTTSLMFVEDGLLGFQIYGNGFFIIDEQTNNKIVEIENLNTFIKSAYYSKKENIFLFTDDESNIHSIIHPSIDSKNNKNNYRTPDQTRKIFSENSEYGKKGFIISDNALYLNGIIYYWYGSQVNGYMFYNLDSDVYIFKNNEIFKTFSLFSENELLESIAIHPSGDIYILRMNWQTNTHNLYYIENTWDPEWREQWYKDHPSAVRP